MSNTVDILVVGGPCNGRMVNMHRERMTTYIEFPLGGDPFQAKYTRRKWQHPTTGKLYHVATRDEDAVTDEQIVVEATFNNFQPAWDLNQ